MGKAARILGSLALMALTTAGMAQGTEAARPSADISGPLPSVLGNPIITEKPDVELTSGTYAVFHTSEGDILAELHPEWAPNAVSNFDGLATGKRRWRHPITQQETTRPLYSNTNIYRTVPNAMIFGGDPLNKGEADSGILLPLEATPDAQFSEGGLLAMDNAGERVSGSRWFITLRPFPERSGAYTIFGKILGGLDTVQKISLKPVKRPQLPLDPVMVYNIEIIRIPPGRVATGQFKPIDGMKVLRIDPNFKDAPVDLPTAPPRTEEAQTTQTEEAETTETTESSEKSEDNGESDQSAKSGKSKDSDEE